MIDDSVNGETAFENTEPFVCDQCMKSSTQMFELEGIQVCQSCYETIKPRAILTRFGGKYINNDNLQNILLKDARKAREDGMRVLSDYLEILVKNLDKLKD